MSRIFGEIRQNGYIVRNIESAMRYWIEVMGVGPFFYFDRMPPHEFNYRGQPSSIELSIALANSGNLQIELIQQHNEAPSMYLDFLRKGHEGLQHVAYWTETFDADLARLKSAGYEIGQSGGVSDGRFVYFLAEDHPGTVIEFSEISGRKGKFFKRVAESARIWDGSDPIRKR